MTIQWQLRPFNVVQPRLAQSIGITEQYLYSSIKVLDVAEFNEDQIWDAIKDNAKGKIDYAVFASLFPFDPDNFLSSIIYGFAVSRSNEVIEDKIAAQVFMTGNAVDRQALRRFIEESHSLLKEEIAATVMALKMLDDGAEPETVFDTVIEALSSS